MIIDTQQSDIQVIGDIKEFKTGIDPRNIELITTLLSSNLYSNPEKSFIREIVSNAWDSHVEAGTTDIPVIIKFDKDSITIRDYGTGLSPERFKEVYCNIGSSTKRDSNEFIGGFGIGKYSSLACSNTVFITSYYEGMEYSYIMIKDGNNITTTLTNTLPTTEKNGVSVILNKKNIDKYDTYYEGIKSIIFFPNIYIKGKYENINKIAIKKFKYFAFANTQVKDKLLLGNVLYPCDSSNLSTEATNYLSSIYGSGLVLAFNVGELSITPNRENVIYTEETIHKIEEKIKQVKKELKELIELKIVKDYDNLLELHNLTFGSSYYNPVTDKLSQDLESYYDLRVDLTKSIIDRCTYKGNKIQYEFISKLKNFERINPNVVGLITDTEIKKYNPKSYNSNYRKYWKLYNNKIILVSPEIRFTRDIKIYLENNFIGYTIVKDIPLYVEDLIEEGENISDITRYVIQEIINYHLSKAIKIDFKTDKDFLKYKKLIKENNISTVRTKSYILYIYKPDNYYAFKTYHECYNTKELTDYIKKCRNAVVLDYIHPENIHYAETAKFLGYMYITASKPTINLLKELPYKNILTVEEMFSNHKLSIIKTLYNNMLRNNIGAPCLMDIVRVLPKIYKNEISKLVGLYNSWNQGISNLNKFNVKEDTDTIYYCNIFNKYYKEGLECFNIINDSEYVFTSKNILMQLLMVKRNNLRLNYNVYSRIFEIKMFNLLCKK